MRNVSTRLSAVFIFLTLVFFLPSVTSAQEKPVFETQPHKDGVKITGCKGYIGKTLVIPETIDGRPVREIGNGAFTKQVSLVSATLPSGLRTIGIGAFRECASLRRIYLNEGLQAIGNYAFQGCESLERVDFPRRARTIGKGAFQDCGSLICVGFSDGLRAIGDAAFPEGIDFTAPAGSWAARWIGK